MPTRPATANNSVSRASSANGSEMRPPVPSPLEKRLIGMPPTLSSNRNAQLETQKNTTRLNIQKRSVRYYPKLCGTSTAVHSNALRAARMQLSSRGMGRSSRQGTRKSGRSNKNKFVNTQKSRKLRRAIVPVRARQNVGAMPFHGVFFRT